MTESGSNTFILAGNGPYLNRGCEAIVRGTVHILRHHFDSPRFVAYSSFRDKDDLARQRALEKDPDIVHEDIWRCRRRFDNAWFVTNILRRTFPGALKHFYCRNMKPYLSRAEAVLSLGGDNYSLDYGRPDLYTEIDDSVVSLGKPLIIWGASVGPFSEDPAYERYMIKHLRKVHIFARESLTLDYLNQHGLVENVYKVADPAFLLEPLEPRQGKLDGPIDNGAIGINISPLLANYNSGGDLDRWTTESVKIIESIIARTGRHIYLIPHVANTNANNDDYAFLCTVARLLDPERARVFVVPDTLDAAETKWVISKMSLFAGARTHSTIASLSSCVPTLSFGYSVKSRGINQDIYAHTRYCLQANDLAPDTVADRVAEMLSDSKDIQAHLGEIIPRVKADALRAGEILKKILVAC